MTGEIIDVSQLFGNAYALIIIDHNKQR